MSGFRPKKESSETPAAVPPPAGHPVHETPDSAKRLGSALRSGILLAILAAVACWAFGVTFDFSAFKSSQAPVKADTVLELPNGRSVAGKIVSERSDSIVFLMEGSEVPFLRKEIKNIRPATPGEAALETPVTGKRPFISIRREKSLQYKLKNGEKLF